MMAIHCLLFLWLANLLISFSHIAKNIMFFFFHTMDMSEGIKFVIWFSLHVCGEVNYQGTTNWLNFIFFSFIAGNLSNRHSTIDLTSKNKNFQHTYLEKRGKCAKRKQRKSIKHNNCCCHKIIPTRTKRISLFLLEN